MSRTGATAGAVRQGAQSATAAASAITIAAAATTHGSTNERRGGAGADGDVAGSSATPAARILELDAGVADRLQPAPRIFLEASLDQGTPRGVSMGSGAHCKSDLMIAERTSVISPAREGAPCGQHLEEHRPERPDISARVDDFAARLLGRHVGRRAAAGEVTVGELSTASAGPESDLTLGSCGALARPKSRTFTAPSGRTLMLAGLRSR